MNKIILASVIAAVSATNTTVPTIEAPSLRATLVGLYDKLAEDSIISEHLGSVLDKIREVAESDQMAPVVDQVDLLDGKAANLTASLNDKLGSLEFPEMPELPALALGNSSLLNMEDITAQLQEKLGAALDLNMEVFTNTTGLLNDKLADVDTLLAEHNNTLPAEVYDSIQGINDQYSELHQQLADLIAQLSGSAAGDAAGDDAAGDDAAGDDAAGDDAADDEE